MLTWRRSTASAPHLIAEREYGGLDPDYRNWYTLTETGNAVA